MLSIVVPAVSEGYQVLLLSLQVQSNIVPLFVSMSKEKVKESQRVQSQYSKLFIYIFFFQFETQREVSSLSCGQHPTVFMTAASSVRPLEAQ